MRPNASVKMRPAGKLLLRATWIATCNRDCHTPAESRQSAGANNGNSFTLTAVSNAFGGSWRIQLSGTPAPVHRIQENRRNLRIAVQSAAIEKANQPHSNRHPQPVHKARLIIRRKPGCGKKNLPAQRVLQHRLRTTAPNQPAEPQTARAAPDWEAARRMARHRPPELTPSRK
jgi:hypothetical protein